MKMSRKAKKKLIIVHHIFVFALISLVFISQIAVKAWIIENYLKTVNHDKVKDNGFHSFYRFSFIDFCLQKIGKI